MSDFPIDIPEVSRKAEARAVAGRFMMSSEPRVGALLRTLVASKPGGRILEVGAGIGVGAGWMLDGMDADARLTSLEVHGRYADVCRQMLAGDDRVEVVTSDATEWLEAYDGEPFDFAFVDTTITKFHRRDSLFRVLADGAIVVADDLLPQDSWAPEHPPRVELFRKEILVEPDLVPTLLDWASGVVIATYRKPRS
ncbi:O-methyltransferase [Actinoplanes sp. RD1]|uniref:O-methyltransferase n=1 Tax=Actinoplanes sp. RD1 TaxID=3064538 RepID=UPI00274045B5|nr:class I SAM-dependent methyltransferase [Actinoplanes sp. RD1]